ncbi:hypothetical protein QL285_012365 [Trifolium repens]|nr:hypothetical protein QL285_012365 [Trifolium repens]
MVRDSRIRENPPTLGINHPHLSIANTSRRYDKATTSVNTECLHTSPFRARQDSNQDQEKTPPQPATTTPPPKHLQTNLTETNNT